MNKTMMNIMKPLPVANTENGTKAQQEMALMNYLEHQSQSVCSSDAMDDIGVFPGCQEPVPYNGFYKNIYNTKRRSIMSTFGRLEAQGKVISTRFRGKRYYSIPIGIN